MESLIQSHSNWTAIEVPFCPRKFDCTSINTGLNESLVSFDIGRIPSYVAIVSSTLSCLGSILIVVAFLAFRDLRTGAQTIITLLAIADFISAFGYIVGSANFLIFFNSFDDEDCKKVFGTICETQATVTSWSSLCSFSWTLILAFYFYLLIVYNYRNLARPKLMFLYNIVSWGAPLLIIIPLLGFGKLGYAPYAASNWCFVKSENYSSDISTEYEAIAIILVAGKFWEILTYIVVILVYAHISGYLYWLQRRRAQPAAVERAEMRLAFIPVVFIFLRIWGTIQFFFSIGVSHTNHNGCIPAGVRTTFLVLGIVQAIGDPGQGWGNAILYVFMSPTIRQRLFCTPCRRSVRAVGKLLLVVAPSSDHGERAPLATDDVPNYGVGLARPGLRARRAEDTAETFGDYAEPGPGPEPGPPPAPDLQSDDEQETTTEISTSLPI